jgi:hypothetical protein
MRQGSLVDGFVNALVVPLLLAQKQKIVSDPICFHTLLEAGFVVKEEACGLRVVPIAERHEYGYKSARLHLDLVVVVQTAMESACQGELPTMTGPRPSLPFSTFVSKAVSSGSRFPVLSLCGLCATLFQNQAKKNFNSHPRTTLVRKGAKVPKFTNIASKVHVNCNFVEITAKFAAFEQLFLFFFMLSKKNPM